MKKSLFLIISLFVIFLGFSLAQSAGDDLIVDRLFIQFTKGTVQKRITCKNLNATMNALGKSVKLNLTNDPNQVRFNYIKTNFVEKVRTYMNQKLNCASQTNTLNTTITKTSNKKASKKTKESSSRGGTTTGTIPFSLRLYSVTGDFIGQGKSRNFSNNLFIIEDFSRYGRLNESGAQLSDSHFRICSIYPYMCDKSSEFSIRKKPSGYFTQGIYREVNRFPNNPNRNATGYGLDLSLNGRGCNELEGEFYIRQISYTNTGLIKSEAVDFVQYCDGSNKPLYGSFRYNSNLPHSINGNNLSAMKALTCGDGKLDFFEECDKLNNPSCSANCTNLGLSVDLKVNGSNSPSMVNYYDPLIITRQSNGATACYAYGNHIKLRYPKNGLLYWTDLTLPTNTSQTTNNSENLPKHLVAATKRGPMNPLPVSIQCMDIQGNSVTDTVNVPVRQFMYGDLDINNNVNFVDYQAVFKHVNGTKKLTSRAQKCNADVDLNGKIELADGLYIGMYLSGNIDLPYISNSSYGNGDVNQDGTINTQDAYAIATCDYNISYKGFIAGNVNGDDKLDWKDSCIIQNYVVGLITNLPYGGPLPNNCNNTGQSCTKMKTAECSASDSFQVGSFPIE